MHLTTGVSMMGLSSAGSAGTSNHKSVSGWVSQVSKTCIKCRSSNPNRRLHVCRGFLNNLFGSSSSASSPPALEDYSQEDLDFVILKEVEGKEMNIVYRNGATVDATALETLCDRVGWPRRPIFKVEAALANSFLVGTLSLEPKTSTQKPSMLTLHSSADNGSAARLIGLARCTSDGAFNATVWDVVIDPEFQGRGLGKALVECMVRTLLKRDITNITLFADGKAIEFYKQMGFEADPEGIRGMFFIPKL